MAERKPWTASPCGSEAPNRGPDRVDTTTDGRYTEPRGPYLYSVHDHDVDLVFDAGDPLHGFGAKLAIGEDQALSVWDVDITVGFIFDPIKMEIALRAEILGIDA